jgi:hypothetical protein
VTKDHKADEKAHEDPKRTAPEASQADEADEKAAQAAQARVQDANRAAAETLAQPDVADPRREPVDIGKDDRGLDRDVRVDPADNQLRTFVSNNTDGSKDPDTGEKTGEKA